MEQNPLKDTIKVLTVDDSAFMRRMISKMIDTAGDIRVIGTADDGKEGLQAAAEGNPDVITLDIQMPRLNGLQMLKRLMQENPTPVVLLSSLTEKGSEVTVEGLSLGAVDFVTKPSGQISLDIDRVRNELVEKIRTAADARVKRANTAAERAPSGESVVGATVGSSSILALGASTGGPPALETVLASIDNFFRGSVLITQHMPPRFTSSLASRLDKVSDINVKEADYGEPIRQGWGTVAPGGYHLLVDDTKRLLLDDGPEVNYVKPSVDVMLKSLAATHPRQTVAVILTGMGKDGAVGSKTLTRAGGRVVVQDEASSVVWGMPRAVLENEVSAAVASLDALGEQIHRVLSNEHRVKGN